MHSLSTAFILYSVDESYVHAIVIFFNSRRKAKPLEKYLSTSRCLASVAQVTSLRSRRPHLSRLFEDSRCLWFIPKDYMGFLSHVFCGSKFFSSLKLYLHKFREVGNSSLALSYVDGRVFLSFNNRDYPNKDTTGRSWKDDNKPAIYKRFASKDCDWRTFDWELLPLRAQAGFIKLLLLQPPFSKDYGALEGFRNSLLSFP